MEGLVQIIGIFLTIVMPVFLWMFMVHAKLAMLVTQMEGLSSSFKEMSDLETEQRKDIKNLDRRMIAVETVLQ